jgi:putative transposase
MRDDVVKRRRAVVARLVRLRDESALDTAAVTVAAVSLGVHVRTVWRWIEAGGYDPGQRQPWHLTAAAREAYFDTQGNATAAWRRLREAGVEVPSRPVFCRAVSADLSPAERAYARHGENGRRRYELYLRHDPKARNEVWEMDHAQLDIEVLPVRGTRLVKPWLTVIVDGYSRVLMGWALSIRPSTAEVLAALREAIVVDEQRGPWGGVPQLVRFDGGKEFLAEAITRAAGEVGFAATPTAPYSPHKKGKVERLHQTIGKGLIATLPHYTAGPRRRNGKLYAQPDPLSIAQLQAALLDFIDAYNRTHKHASLGMTPAEKWATSSAPLELVPREQLWSMLMADQTRKVLKDGIHFGGQIFIGPKLARYVGRTVEIRYMPHDLRSIEVSIEPEGWLCTAYPQDQLSREDAEAVIAARQEAAREMGRRKATASRRARARTAPLTGNTVVGDITVITRRDKPLARRGLTDAASNQLLEMLGLADELNKPAPPRGPSEAER